MILCRTNISKEIKIINSQIIEKGFLKLLAKNKVNDYYMN